MPHPVSKPNRIVLAQIISVYFRVLDSLSESWQVNFFLSVMVVRTARQAQGRTLAELARSLGTSWAAALLRAVDDG
jgi:hypothetical protein